MSRITLFQPTTGLKDRLEELAEEDDLSIETAKLLMHVELAFELMRFLGLDDEPVTVAWAILSGTPIRHYRLQHLDEANKRAIANARQVVPFSSRFAWIDALREYRDIPERWRNYDLDEEGEALELPERFISQQKNVRQFIHQRLYEDCLQADLEYTQRVLKEIIPGDIYQFRAKTHSTTVTLHVKFPQDRVADSTSMPTEWFSGPCVTAPVTITLGDLAAEAECLDQRERALEERYGWPAEKRGHWVKRFEKIDFRCVGSDGRVESTSSRQIDLDGFMHIAGMVASGKTTLILLLAAYLQRHHPKQRITLVVGDVQSAIRLANQINGWFREDPERETPVATPILGKGQQHKNRRNFIVSKDYAEHRVQGQAHWGERWLSTGCPLQGLLDSTEIHEKLKGSVLIPGDEPCHSLKALPRKGQRSSSFYGCPFFSTCPSKQAYRDLPASSIWITTPGAMAMAGLPRQLDLRPIKVGELVYEQSDIVVFDEVETVSQWFDDVYAQQLVLVNEKDGVFDEVSIPTEEYMRDDRVPARLTQYWVGVERDALKAVTATLALLDEKQGYPYLQKWVSRGYFTPFILLFRLARRLSGLLEFDGPDVTEAECSANRQLVRPVVAHFDYLMRLRLLETDPNTPDEVVQLSAIAQSIYNAGASAGNQNIQRACKRWIQAVFPDVEEQLKRLKEKVKRDNREFSNKSTEEDVDDLAMLARRLQFSLTVCLLDLHTRTVLYEWQNSPPTVRGEAFRQRQPAAMMDILSLPTTGRQFGTYYAQPKASSGGKQANNVLSLFAYTNIGRQYVLNFHQLLTDLDGRRGPNVLALSGTSYLPHSTQFHLEAPPKGVLRPEESAMEAIAQSTFEFSPQYKHDQAIRISGQLGTGKMSLFKDVAKALVENSKSLPRTLAAIEELASEDLEHWQDRGRILLLVNSYDQARWTADELHQCWTQQRGAIYHLCRNNAFGDELHDEAGSMARSQPLQRSDIESFGQTNGKILVAPLNAVGRGFNILNSHGKAAFGAVYFLTRPYPHPQDTQAIAKEMNRRANDWVKDETFEAWQEDGIAKRAEALRRISRAYWRSVEQRAYYRTLIDDDERESHEEKLGAFPRKDLAATTVGLVIQAVGRLLRGGVPFKGYFVDAAWAPNSAIAGSKELDTVKTSLLVAMILLLCDYAQAQDPVGHTLYEPLAHALENTEGLRW